jgi:hypothetical protein
VKNLMSLTLATLALFGQFVFAAPAQASALEASDVVTLTAPSPSDVEFNAIATWNPLKRAACLYDSTGVKVPSSTAEPWVTPGDCRSWSPPVGIESGIYVASWDSGKSKALLVLSAEPMTSKHKQVLVIVPDFTWQAYDLVGKGNFYFEGVGKKSANFSARRLNLLRPMNFQVVGDSRNYPSAPQLYPSANPVRFLRSHFQNVDVVSQSNLDEYSYNLADYQTVVLFGHDEYWTAKEKSGLEGAVAQGTSLLNLSGNTGYRKLVRDGDIIGFETPTQDHPKTSIWGELPGDTTALKLLGAVYLGEPFDKRQVKPVKITSHTVRAMHQDGLPSTVNLRGIHSTLRGMMVKEANNPLFAGTGLRNGDFFGAKSGVMTIELDGIPELGSGAFESGFTEKFGSGAITSAADAWTNARQSGENRAWRAGQLIQTTYGRGRVFTAGPIGWTGSLVAGDQTVEKITLNALRYLGQEPLN